MPCIAFPNPSSVSSTLFTFERRHFTQKSLPDDFPYEAIRDNGLQVHYFEFRGQGAPPDDVGHPGDVWLNLKPGEYALHARLATEWVLWPGPRKAKKQMFAHPLVDGRYLWCTRKHVLWYTCDGIRKSASLQMRGEEEDFGRRRYRTVGPMERGGSRAGDDGVSRMPLRTAAEAIAKILEMEEEERRNGREPPEPKRRRIRDADSASVGSSTRSAKTREGGSDRQESAVPVSAEPSTSTAVPQPQPPQPPTDSHLRQPYNTHTFPLQSTPSSLSQALEPPVNITVQPPVSRPVVAPAASQARIPYTQPPTVAVVPVTAQAVQTSAPIPTTALRMLEGEIHRMREETRRLSEENRRLNDENTRLTEENRRLRAQPSALCPPDLISAVKDSMASTLGSRVAGREYPL